MFTIFASIISDFVPRASAIKKQYGVAEVTELRFPLRTSICISSPIFPLEQKNNINMQYSSIALVRSSVMAALLVACQMRPGSARDTVNFDFAWRHVLGNPGAICRGTIEKDINYGDGGTQTIESSSADCCIRCETTPGCVAWDWHSKGGECWAKPNGTGSKVDPGVYSARVKVPAPAGPPPAAAVDYNDASWAVVDCPHDMLVTGKHDPSNSPTQGFLPRGEGWYRKHFNLPQDWKGDAVWVYIEGVFLETQWWLNGVSIYNHTAGYTSFWIRLDGPAARFGGANVLAVYVNAKTGTGWWYEGGGLSRHQYLVRANPLHLVPDRAWAHTTVTGEVHALGESPSHGIVADAATMYLQADVTNAASSSSTTAAAQEVALQATINDADGTVVGTASSKTVSVDAGATVTLSATALLANAQLWSVARPYVYTVSFSVVAGGSALDVSQVYYDSVNVTTGIKTVKFDTDAGLIMNGENVKVRGFCDHSNWGGVGAAVPDRINLFRAQGLRAVGANTWRMAHNPPIPVRIDIMDRLGMLCMDENRNYGGARQQGGTTDESIAQEAQDMADMVQRDRSHASILIWSFCNEVGCDNETSAALFRNISYFYDGTHPVTQNHLGAGEHPLSADSLDVQGMSHKSGSTFDTFHSNNPKKPIMATECCSCLSQRGEDYDACPKPRDCSGSACHKWCGGSSGSEKSNGTFYNNEISQCTAEQVYESDSRKFVAGTFIWSGYDYLGEARGWPQTVKPRGTVADIAGFRKESAWWLKAYWLSNISRSDPGRPALPDVRTIFLVESWREGLRADNSPMPSSRTIHVYTDAPRVRMLLNGKQAAPDQDSPQFGNLVFTVPYAPGNLTALALDASGAVVATHTRMTVQPAVAIRLRIDAPSAETGTGSAMVADGEDVAMVRAELVDASGNIAAEDMRPVTFAVASGEGRVWATHSGNPVGLEPPHSPTRKAYHGLARAIVRSTADRATSPRHRALLRAIDCDHGRGGTFIAVPEMATNSSGSHASDAALDPIVVTASAPGLTPVRIEIPVTTDLNQLPVAIAGQSEKANSITSDF